MTCRFQTVPRACVRAANELLFLFSFLFFFRKLDMNSYPLVFVSTGTSTEKRQRMKWVSSYDLENRSCSAQLHAQEANFVHQTQRKCSKCCWLKMKGSRKDRCQLSKMTRRKCEFYMWMNIWGGPVTSND